MDMYVFLNNLKRFIVVLIVEGSWNETEIITLSWPIPVPGS